MANRPMREPLESRYSLGGIAILAACGITAWVPGSAATLPVPCAAAACAGVGKWITSGAAALAQSGNRMDITQTSNSATLNWQSFNVSADGTVNFIQPSSSAVAINRIFQADPSRIFGTLTSNGQVYLLNPNGLIFGPHSVVSVGGLVASTLSLTKQAVQDGIVGAIQDGAPAFEAVDANGKPIQNLGVIQVQSGANITTSNQGEVLILAPTVDNEGTIQAPSGQAILGAGQRVFLSASRSTDLRGLLIEVGGTGTVTNGTSGQVISTAGDVTLAALAVNQMGRVSATTTIDSNGSIRLQARSTTTSSISPSASKSNSVQQLGSFETGPLVLGAGSSTEVSLQGSSSETTVDATTQPASTVELDGGEIELLDGASIVAPHGNVTLTALSGPLIDLQTPTFNLTNVSLTPDSSRIWLAPSSEIDVSGTTVSQSASLNSLAVELNSVELADSPQQRNGPLHGQTVYVDIRQHGVTSNGTPWVGTPIADLSGDVAAIQRDVFQRSLTGGTISLNSSGSVIVSPGAALNVSGGQIDWQAGYVKSSVLVGVNGQTSSIAAADPYLPYIGTLDKIDQSDPHWGSTAIFTLPGYDPRGAYQPAYVQGMDAGTVGIVAPAFVLDGTIEGTATRGPLQVNPPESTIPAAELYRYADQVPLGGELIVGNSVSAANAVNRSGVAPAEVLQGLTFSTGQVLASLTGSSSAAFDPAVDSLPNGFVSSLQPEIFGASGISRLRVYAEGGVTLPAGTVLDLGAGGSATLEGGRVDIAGSIVANDGAVTLETVPTPLFGAGLGEAKTNTPSTQLELTSTASIDLSGAWVNQDPTLGRSAQQPLFTSGGVAQFLAVAGGSLILSPGAAVKVDGGAERTAKGSLIAGKGGSIVVAAVQSSAGVGNPQGALTVDASLTGYALENGGSLSVTLPAICISAAACTDSNAYRVDPSYLTDFGFGNISLASNGTPGGLVVAQDVDSSVRQLNLEFTPGSFRTPSARSLQGLTTVVALPQYLRQPEALSLSSSSLTAVDPSGVSYSDLTVSEGASLAFDPQASVSLTTNSRIFMNGSIVVPAGQISLAILGGTLQNSNAETVLANQGIWLGSDSTLDATGTVVLSPNKLGLALGTVLPGGAISVTAGRGYLLALPGSSILAAGTSAAIDESSPGSGIYHLATVASAGGSIALSASEGMQLDGTLAAPAGSGASAEGGSLSITLDGDDARANNVSFDKGNTALDAARVLTIAASTAPTVVAEGAAVPDSLNGQGRISAGAISAGGFDNVSLIARNLLGQVPGPNGNGTVAGLEAVGAVAFDPGVSLSPRSSLIIAAPEVRASAGAVSLDSAYVALGSTDTLSQQVNNKAMSGAATLSVTGQLIDLVGAMDLNGFGRATLSSSGDIRTIGVQLDPNLPNANSDFTGSLVSPAALTLSAQQIYPTTLTSYDIKLTGATPTQSTLILEAAPGTPGDVLSAAGSLTLQANQILDSGVLRAPIGTIDLAGVSLTDPSSSAEIPSTVRLSSGAVISVSADGSTIPFGETQAGLYWTYVFRGESTGNNQQGDTVVYGTSSGDTPLPQKQVTVSGSDVTFSPGATIDVSGGGDLVAYEFTPGLGGTNDVLSTAYAPNTYAVIPGIKLPYAPIDPHEDIGFTQGVGSSVYLAGGNGLPAGTYALLPARYALLPGAYLVKQVPGYTDLAPGQTDAQTDGSVIVSGYRTVSGTGIRDSRTSGWDVMPGTYAYQEAQYTLTSANAFFAAQAKSDNVTSPRLPVDAGALAIQASAAAELGGKLLGDPAAGARGATLDLTATNLFIGSNPADAPAGAAYVTVDPAQLDALGAQSILLGATRSETGNTTNLAVSASNVVVGQGSILTAPEVILAASGALEIGNGAQIRATGPAVAAEATFVAPAGTALVRASSGPQVSLSANDTASASAGGASLTVSGGATISATGSMSFDASGVVDFQGSLSAANTSVRIGASDIALGSSPATFTGFAIGPSLLANLANSQLALDATDPIAVYGPIGMSLSTLEVTAPGFDVSQGGALAVTAQSVTLRSPVSNETAVAGTGSVSLDAAHIMLGDGTFAVTGAATTSLNATADLTSVGNGALETQGSLSLTGPVMQSESGKDYRFSAGGALSTALPTAGIGNTSSDSGPGGAFTFVSTGSGVKLGGNIVLPGGRVQATAGGGDVTVSAGAVVNVSGFSETFDGDTRSADGGTVDLSSRAGNVTIAPSALVDVSAGSGGGAGGALSISAAGGTAALSGQIHGAGASGQTGGSLTVEAQSLDFASLVALDGTAGFSGAFDVHERGIGDLALGAGTSLHATDVELTADQGKIQVDGNIDASTDLGGMITLAARDDIVLNGSLDAGSATRVDRGGTVKLYTSRGGIYVDSGSSIDVGGAGTGSAPSATGTVWLRAPVASVLSVLGSGPPQVSLAGAVTGAAHIYLEGYQQVNADAAASGVAGSGTNGQQIDGTVIGNAYAAATNFMSQAVPATGVTVAQALGQDKNPAFTVLPGIEIDAPGDLTLTTAWDFSSSNASGYAWHFGPNQNIPGVLTLRAGGSLYVNQSISDGFDGTTEFSPVSGGFAPDPANALPGWSYRLVGGAYGYGSDVNHPYSNSANPLAVQTSTALAASPAEPNYGSVIVAPGQLSSITGGATAPTMIRTGTGSIEIAAGADLTLGNGTNQAAVIYTAGVPYSGPTATVSDNDLGFSTYTFGQGLSYPVGGGDVSINVGEDVIGAPNNQLFTNWLWRSGESGGSPVSWAPAFDYFEQGIGALGGGDLTIRAGGNVLDLSANVPSTGIPVIDATGSVTTTELNNGVLRISAGGNIDGGKFLDMAGEAFVTAGGQITVGSNQSGPGTGLYPILALGGGQFAVTARQGLSIDAIVDPTMLSISAQEHANLSDNSWSLFSTYGDASRVTLSSVAGDVDFLNRQRPLEQASPQLTFSGLELYTLPPTLQAVALGGNVNVSGDVALWPSAHGNLNLLAAGSVLLNQVTLRLSDSDPSKLPTVNNPTLFENTWATTVQANQGPSLEGLDPTALETNTSFYTNVNAPSPIHAGAYAADGLPDPVPARVVALDGDVSFIAPAGSSSILDIAKPVDVIAGGDIINPNLFVQQFSSANITNVTAGGKIGYTDARDSTGALLPNVAGITVAGPGRLEIQAGSSVDLQTSAGISTIGNLDNPALPAQGADITVSAGVSQTPQYQSFINTYLTQSDAYDSDLIQYVEQLNGTTGLDKSQALTALDGMSAEQQAPLLQQILFDELRAGGRAAAGAGPDHGNFTSAFDALTTLFPNSDAASAKDDPYSGDILLYFSKVYTQNGGDINLIAPGGLVNVGLAEAPSAFGLQKQPSDLGIVAQQQGSINVVSYSDIDVNQSRVFAADGGNILMWSTRGNIDAGRGARSAISAPPPTVTFNPASGAFTVAYPPALTGSGIQALTTTPGTPPGSVDLFAPHGVVNANEAGIVAGNITIYAVQVLGTNNISFSGTAVGVPVAVTGLGVSLAGASSAGAAAGSVGESTVTQSSGQNQAPQAQAALNWLDVFILGLGEAQCAPADLECIKKQEMHH